MNKLTIINVVIFLSVVAGIGYWYMSNQEPAPTTVLPASKDDLIVVNTPLPNSVISSPLTISGAARGYWYFEASFPAKIYDSNGTLLGVTPIQAQGEWMTEEYVPFSTVLTFDTSTTPTGTLVLEKDNASGLPEHANELRIPIKFQTTRAPSEDRVVQLYYYNPALDQGPGGAQCSRSGLVAVERTIPLTVTPLKDAIVLLLQGTLTEAERAQGITTEFPLSGVSLTSAAITDGVATLTLADPQSKTSGGSCRAGVLWFQIEATAKQFSNVTSVRFMPANLFQP